MGGDQCGEFTTWYRGRGGKVWVDVELSVNADTLL